MSEKIQTYLIYWGFAFLVIYGITLGFLLHMIPPPSAALSAVDVAQFYKDNSFQIRLGATIASWTSAFAVPFAVVFALQVARLEKGTPVWGILCFAGGILMSMFLVFPPICWGVAAFTPERAPEITALMHELGTLTLVTTDQFFIFQMIPIGIVSLAYKNAQGDPLSAYPRWLGYLTLWIALLFEVGAIAFMMKTGPFSWNGIFVYWVPLSMFGVWLSAMSYSILGQLKKQAAANNT